MIKPSNVNGIFVYLSVTITGMQINEWNICKLWKEWDMQRIRMKQYLGGVQYLTYYACQINIWMIMVS